MLRGEGLLLNRATAARRPLRGIAGLIIFF